jgi:hypothetical protein
MAQGAKEVQDYMGDYMEYDVEYRVYSIVVVAFVFFVFDDTKIFVSMQITRRRCCEIMHTTQRNTQQYHESTILWRPANLSGVWRVAPRLVALLVASSCHSVKPLITFLTLI